MLIQRFTMNCRNLAFLNNTAYNINDTVRNLLSFAEANPTYIDFNIIDRVVRQLEEIKFFSAIEGDELIWEPLENRWVTVRHFFSRWGCIERRPIVDYYGTELDEGAESIASDIDDDDLVLDLDGETIDSEEERQLTAVVDTLVNFRSNRMRLAPLQDRDDPVREIIDLTDGDDYVIDLTED